MRIALGIEYDGSAFFGWQRQAGTRTVQGCLEQAVSQVANHPVTVVCAGRTDTGVHATGQVVHFDSEAPRSLRSWLLGINSNLPADANVSWVQPVEEDFHARFRAESRQYRYVILNRPTRSALLRQRVCWEHQTLDESAMGEGARHLLGEHDFTSFRTVACQAKHPVRTLQRLDVQRSGEFIYIDVQANAFLHHMVRNIAGVLIAVGRGERAPDWVAELLAARDRSAGGVTAAAAGLSLVGVNYPAHFGLPTDRRLPVFS